MDVPLEIAFRNTDHSDALERRIRERVEKMHRYFGRINSCHVVVEAPHRSQVKAKGYHVRIETRVPETELVVSQNPGAKEAHHDPYVAVRDAFDAMDRQLEQHSQKVRGDVKTHDGPPQGVVSRLFKDHGFVETVDGRDIYFHRNAVVDADFDALEKGCAVELSVMEGESPMGPQATTIRPIPRMRLDPGAR